MNQERKSHFLSVYQNLPLNERRNTIIIVEEKDKKQPISWDIAFLEINAETTVGETILNKLIKLKLI
jgi:hypothetical protein